MTQLLDRPSASSSTLHVPASTTSPGLQAAEEFYLWGGEGHRQIAIQGPHGDPRGSWLASYMAEQINDLLQLRSGWDGDKAVPPSDAAVRSAMDLLFEVATDLTLPPQVFPLPDGGLQLEWHAGQSVEIEVDAAGDVHVLVTDDAGVVLVNEEWTSGDQALLRRTREAIKQLSVRLTSAR